MKMSLKLKKMKNMRRFMVRDLCGSAPIGGGQGGKKALQIRISFSIPWKLCKTGKMGMLGLLKRKCGSHKKSVLSMFSCNLESIFKYGMV